MIVMYSLFAIGCVQTWICQLLWVGFEHDNTNDNELSLFDAIV